MTPFCAVTRSDAVRPTTDVEPDATVSPFFAVIKLFAVRDFATYTFPLIDESLTTNKRLLAVRSPPDTKTPFCAVTRPDAVRPTTDVTPDATVRPFCAVTNPVTDASPDTNKRLFAVRSPPETVTPFCAVTSPDAVSDVTDVAPDDTVRPFCAVTNPPATVCPVIDNPLPTVAFPLMAASPRTNKR